MGVVNSCCIPTRAPSDNSNHGNQIKIKDSNNSRNLSATFNVNLDSMSDLTTNDPGPIDDPTPNDLLNINEASEEELMTLPGVNRVMAGRIVDYRLKIGGYRRVEDLALASGVGADKLIAIKPEVCVRGGHSSQGTTPAGSQIDLDVDETLDNQADTDRLIVGRRQPPPRVSINSANVFQLMKVRCMTQAFAESIVTFRDKRGPFKTIDELTRVRGIGYIFVENIRSQIRLDENCAQNNI